MITTEPLTEPTLVTLPGGPSAVVRAQARTLDSLRPLFDTGFTAIASSGVEPVGPAFAIYLDDPSGTFDLELGQPIAEPLAEPVPGLITVEASELPVGEALGISHLGAYGSLHEDWARLGEEAERQNVRPSAWLEVYVTEPRPDMDPTTLRTDLFLVL